MAALNVAKKFTMKGGFLPICQTILFDPENQRIAATDLDTAVVIPLEMTDYEREITIETDSKELTEKKKTELVELCKAAGISVEKTDKKPDLIKKLSQPEKKTFIESFCADRKFIDMVKTTETETINLHIEQAEGENLFKASIFKLTIGENFKSIFVNSKEDFPITDIPENPHTVDLDKTQIGKMAMIKTNDDAGFVLNCVLFDGENNKLVSTDGHRLHMLDCKLDTDEKILVNSVALRKICTCIKDEKISLSCSQENTVMKVNDITVVSRNHDGKFPDYKSVLGSKLSMKVDVNKEALKKACEQSLILADSQYLGAKFCFNGGISVSTINPERGKYEKFNIPLKKKVDPEITLGLNAQYVKEAMTAFDGDEVNIRLKDQLSPLVFSAHEDFSALIMPMRV